MKLRRGMRRMTRTRLTLLFTVTTCGLLFAMQLPASALDVTDTPAPVTGNATWFAGLGGPYGGCGMTQDALESPDFVALNVYDTPGDYSDFPTRPMPDSLSAKFGMWNNGHNCGRWVTVTIGEYCTGVNDGATDQPFCRNGSWVSDGYTGATLTMLVADSCGDGNAWCRDDPYHLDLARPALNRFVRNGTPVGDMDPDHWNNRHVSWQFVPAPNYTGDIQIGFLQSAQPYWPALAISRLPNGIHRVEYWDSGAWKPAQMDGDMGQAWIVGPTGASTYQLRVRDVNDQLINNGRVYTVTLPASCGSSCDGAYTQVGYTTSDQPTTPGPGSSGGSTGTCTATVAVANSWPGGYQAQVTVTNTGTRATGGWSVGLTLPGPQTVRSSWNATVTQTGQQVTAASVAYNSTVPAGGSTTWGMVVDGSGSPVSTLTCSAG
jgi:cellulose binding protein with CBM2 domain